MKILILNQVPKVNNKYTFSLAKALIKQGIDVTVCGIEGDIIEFYKDIPCINIFGSYSKKHGLIQKFYSYKKSWRNVFEYCKKQKIDIVHVQWYIFSPLDWIYHRKLKKNKIKIVTTIHDLLPFNEKFYDFYFLKKIYSEADLVVNQALANKKKLVNEFGVNKDKIVYIPHGHYMEYAESVSKEKSRYHLGIECSKPVVLFFGQIKKVKGVDILLLSMRKVIEKYPDVLCVIAGKIWKDDFSVYQKIIDEFHLKENVRTDIKFIDDDLIKYYFNAADIIALPYRKIYQSGVVFLAFAYEKPIIATTEGEFLTVVKDKETGLLVPAGDAEELADAIIWYLDNPQVAEEYAKAGKKDVSVRFGWDTIAHQLIDGYSVIMKR